jgi:hypothetical protein
VPGIVSVTYNIAPKPPSTIEAVWRQFCFWCLFLSLHWFLASGSTFSFMGMCPFCEDRHLGTPHAPLETRRNYPSVATREIITQLSGFVTNGAKMIIWWRFALNGFPVTA